ncbi:hypothetical protein [Priestia megaterium]|uniref:hypothetical protein n=1 Tax=Priestia megaterium TaxID=1404 RepID=UPI0027A2CF51|nr:hypothetical protein [Priestia megaterium]WDC90571.1 hypothetical protein PSR56_11195 [Priestia megaterium]
MTKWEDQGADVVLSMKTINKELQNNKGTMDKMTKNVEQSFGARLKGTLREAGTALLPLGNILLSVAENILPKVSSGVQAVSSFISGLSPALQTVGLIFAGLLAALGPVITMVGMFVGAIGNLLPVFTPVMGAIARAGGLLNVLRAGLAALTGPVGIVIGTITLLGAGFVALYRNSQTFRDGVSGVMSDIQKLGQSALNILKPAIESVKQFFQSQLSVIKQFWQDNSTTTLQALSNIGSVVRVIFQGVSSVIGFVMPFILSIIKSVWGNIQGVISGALNIIMGLVKVFSGLFTGDFSKMWEGLQQIFKGAVQFIWNFVQLQMFGKLLSLGKVFISSFRGAFVGLWNALKSLFSSSAGAAKNAVVGSWNILKSVTTTIFNAYRSFLSGIWNFLKSMISKTASGIVSAVRGSWNILKSVTTSIFNSVRRFLNSLWTGVQKTVSNLASRTKDGVVNAWSTLRNKTIEIFTSIKTKTSKIFEDIVSGAKKLPGRIGDGIRSMAGKVKDGVSAVGKKLAGGLESVMNTITQKGINVVLDKIGVSKKNQIPRLDIPGYATGTDFHPGGWAIVGDGGKQELLRTPDGRMALSPDTDTLMDLPRGTQVLSGEQTEEFMSMFPAYKKGTGVKDVTRTAGKWLKDIGGKALEKAGEAKGKVSDSIGDIWSYMSDPKKLMNKVFSSLNLKMPDVGGIMGELAKAGVTKVKDGAANFIKKMFGDFGASVAAPAGKGVERWRSVILKAAATMKESVSPAEVNGILAQIKRESGGNEKIIQSSAVWDVNTAAGNPARGLLQYIPQTFNAYKVKGHNNIYSGYDQLLAFFNNTTWRRDLPYGRRGWGPRGRRKYKNGTGILGHIGGSAILGDGGKVEPFLMPNGLLGLSPDSATLYPNLPKGTMVWPSIQDFIKEYSEAAASVIATNENQRTDAMKLLALAGKEIQRNKRSNSLSAPGGNTSSADQGQQQVLSIHIKNHVSVSYSGLPNRDDVIKFAKWLQEIMDEQTEQQLRAKGVRWVVHGQSY